MNLFEDHISFHTVKNNNNNSLKAYCLSLDNIVLTSLLDSSIALVVMDASIKNRVATSIVHIHRQDCPIVKTIHHAINVTSTEAELFIRCSINQAMQLQGLNKIIIVTDSIHSAKKIFDYSSHSHQVHSAAISCELREFFSINNTNIIKFWESPSCCKWFLHSAVDSETRKY